MRPVFSPWPLITALLLPLAAISQSNMDIAYQAYNQNDYQKAITYSTEAINLNGSDWRAYSLRGSARIQTKDYDNAISDLNSALSNFHENDNNNLRIIYWNRGLAYMDRGDYQNGGKDFAQAIPYYSGDNQNLAVLYYDLGECNYHLAFYSIATDNFNRSADLNPSYGYAYWGRGLVDHAQKDYSGAINEYAKAARLISNEQDLSILHSNMAFCELYLGKDSLALDDANRSSAYNPANGQAYFAGGQAYQSEWKFNEAAEFYSKALSLITDPTDLTSLHIKLGYVYYSQGKNDLAEAECRKALDLDPNNFQAYFYLGKIFEQPGSYEKAVEYIRKSLSLDRDKTNQSKEHYALAECYRFLQRYEPSVKEYGLAIQSDPNGYFNYMTFIDKGNTETWIYEYRDALDDFQKALKGDADSIFTGDIYVDMAKVYIYSGKFAQAEGLLGKALAARADTGLYDYNRAYIEYYKKNYPQAMALSRKAVSHLRSKYDKVLNYHLMGMTSRRLHEMSAAETYLDSAISLTSGKAYYLQEKARLYLRDGRVEDAKQTFAKAVVLETEAKDTTSTTAYCESFMGNRETALDIIRGLILKARSGTGILASELYNLACLQNLSGQGSAALRTLGEALAAGYGDYSHLMDDDDLASLRQQPAFQELLKKYRRE